MFPFNSCTTILISRTGSCKTTFVKQLVHVWARNSWKSIILSWCISERILPKYTSRKGTIVQASGCYSLYSGVLFTRLMSSRCWQDLFYLADIAQQWYLSLPDISKSTIQNLKTAFHLRFGKQKNCFDIDVLGIKQTENESCEKFISRIQQITFDDDIPELTLATLIAKGLQPSIAVM